jgi:hypothetical protein
LKQELDQLMAYSLHDIAIIDDVSEKEGLFGELQVHLVADSGDIDEVGQASDVMPLGNTRPPQDSKYLIWDELLVIVLREVPDHQEGVIA